LTEKNNFFIILFTRKIIDFNIKRNKISCPPTDNINIKNNAFYKSASFKGFVKQDTFSKEPEKNIFQMNHAELKYHLQVLKNNPELLEKFLLQQDSGGNNFLVSSDKAQAELIIGTIKDNPQLLEKMILQTDYKGFVPAQLVDNDTLEVILGAIKDKPELSEKFLTVKDYEGDSILSYGNSFSRIEMILNALKRRYDVLEKVLLSKNIYGNTPVQTLIPAASVYILKNLQGNLYLLKKITESHNKNGKTFMDNANKKSTELYYRLSNEPILRRNLKLAQERDYDTLLDLSLEEMIYGELTTHKQVTDNDIINTTKYSIDVPSILMIKKL